ncbi:MAG: peptidase [Ktedonobacterales bacterium]
MSSPTRQRLTRDLVLALLLGVMLALTGRPAASTRLVRETVAQAAGGTTMGYATWTFADVLGASMTFYVHVPDGYDPTRRYPLVLLLHGGGERGNSNATPAQNRDRLLTLPYVRQWASPAVQSRWPSFIVIPQVLDDHRWVNVPAAHGSYSLAANATDTLRLAVEVIGALQRSTYAGIDSQRLYITGMSMGGYGVWEAVERWPSTFAAAAPIAGAGDPAHAGVLARMPIWAFHGVTDSIVPVSGSRDMIRAIQRASGEPRYTEYAATNHDIWMRVYTSQDFLSWLFAQKAAAP